MNTDIINLLKDISHPLQNPADLDPLIDEIGNAKIVLLGEASHGTHEFYTWRTMISKRLIEEKDFRFIAVEGDWPDCYLVNRYIKGYSDPGNSASEVLKNFTRWPTWMWGNWEIAALTEWLHSYNHDLSKIKKIGFFGLDVYSLWESMEAIMKYLSKKDKAALKTAEEAFNCFEPYKYDDGISYARYTSLVPGTCEEEVMELLREIKLKRAQYNTDPEEVLSAVQNATVAVNAEKYYRSMLQGNDESWNIRDRHMMQTLKNLLDHHGREAKGIVWAHNTHVGDARATDMKDAGMINIGQLAREEFGRTNVFIAGFSSYTGTVLAGERWGAPSMEMEMPEAVSKSIEALLHEAGEYDKILLMIDLRNEKLFKDYIRNRAIGVVYNPKRESWGNYVPSIIPERYDALLFIDESSALHPMGIKPHGEEVPETYPWGV
jgi:erythromycin esterase